MDVSTQAVAAELSKSQPGRQWAQDVVCQGDNNSALPATCSENEGQRARKPAPKTRRLQAAL